MSFKDRWPMDGSGSVDPGKRCSFSSVTFGGISKVPSLPVLCFFASFDVDISVIWDRSRASHNLRKMKNSCGESKE